MPQAISIVSIMPFKPKSLPLLKLFWAFIVLTIFSFSVVSVYQLNAYTAETYANYGYENKIEELSRENKILEINLAKANSLWNIESYAQGFEKIGKLEYIRVLESTALAK